MADPVESLADLDIVLAHPVGRGPRVEIIDRRGDPAEIVSLSPREASYLAGLLVSRSARADRGGWISGPCPDVPPE